MVLDFAMESRLDLLDNFEGIRFTIGVTVSSNTEMDFVITGVLLEGNVCAKNSIRRSHLDILNLSIETAGTLKDSANVVKLVHILVIMTSF